MELNMFAIVLSLCILQCHGQSNVNNEYNCVNPNKNIGLCQSLYYCPTLLNVLRNPTSQRFINESTCSNGFGPPPFICCTNEIDFIEVTDIPVDVAGRNSEVTNNAAVSTPITFTGNYLLATPDECDSRTAFKENYVGNADIRDFHWMAIVGRKTTDGLFQLKCTGFLISHRYILTAANCALFANRTNGAIVRLGEYDLQEETDCVDGNCLDPVIDVGIEQTIINENKGGRRGQNFIALIRLAEYVDYSESISPICLPSTVGFTGSKIGDILIVSGWASVERNGQPSRTKLQTYLPILDQKNCSLIFGQQYLGSDDVNDFQACVGRLNENKCEGDSGEPLTKMFNNKWVAEGIFSYGRICNTTSVFTEISKHENWIIENVKE